MMLKTTVRLAARNTLRRKVRSALTAGMVVFGVAMLMLALTWVRGIFGAMISSAAALGGHVRVVTEEFEAREEMMPLYANLSETAPLEALLRQQPGVSAVEPRIATGVTVTVGEEIGEVFALAVGANESYFRERLELDQRVVDGKWFSGAPDELVAGATVVQQAGAKVGDELVLLGMTQDGSLSPIKGRLVGVVHAGGGGLDRQVLVPLEKVRYLADIPDGATELLVYTDDYQKGPALSAQLAQLPGLRGLKVQSWAEREPWRSLGGTVKGMEAVIVGIFVFLTALGIWNTLMMSVLERTPEIGVLRAMGLSRMGAVGLFVGEAVSIAVVGGALGVLLALYPAWLLETHGIRLGERVASNLPVFSEVLRGNLSWEIVATSFGLGLLMAVLGSVLPALRAANIQPVSAMRSGR